MEISFSPERYVTVKPDFKTGQEGVLEKIKVSSINEAVGPIYQDILDKNKDFYGFKSYKISENHPDDRVIFIKNRNNTGMIQNIFHINNTDIIDRCVFMDFNTNKAFKLDDLITTKKGDNEAIKPTIIYKNNILQSSVFFTAPGLENGMVIWNDNEIQKKAIDLRFGKGMGNLTSYISLFHELGHSHQLTVGSFGDKFSSFSDLKGKMKNGEEEKMVDKKRQLKEMERNAWAFSFAVARKLRDQGLDLMRGFDTDKVKRIAEIALKSYDIPLNKIPGESISSKNRAKGRRNNSLLK